MTKKTPTIELPRGLWVGKLPRGKRGDRGEVPEGVRPWDLWPEDYSPMFFYRLVRKGQKVIQKCTGTADYREAVKFAKLRHAIWERGFFDKEMQRMEGVLSGVKRRVCTGGEVFAAYAAVYPQRPEPIRAARRLFALAQGWIQPGDYITRGCEVAQRVDAASSEEIFSARTVRGFYTAEQGGKFDPLRRDRKHNMLNQTRGFAAELFARRARALCYAGLELPDLTGFLEHPTLKEEAIDPREKAISPEDYAAMVAAARRLYGGDAEGVDVAGILGACYLLEGRRVEGSGGPSPHRVLVDAGELVRALGLANWIFRLLGLRTKEALYLRRSWVFQDARSGRWYVDVRSRPAEGFIIKGKEEGQVPVCEDLRLAMLGEGEDDFVLVPGWTMQDRVKLLRAGHNRWVKGFLGERYNRQGNHLLRANVASYVASKYGDRVAGMYIRHADTRSTAAKHYLAPRGEELPVVTDADLLGGWGRAAGAGENIEHCLRLSPGVG